MPAKIKSSDIQYAIELIFNQGMTVKEASVLVGFNPSLISKCIRSMGMEIPRIRKNLKQLPDDEIIAMYKSNLSELHISKHFNVSRAAIRNRLKQAGIEIRSQSQANIVSMARMTSEQRKQRAKKANDALRGATQCREGREKRSRGIEINSYENMIGFGEKEFKKALEDRGINFVWQKSCGIYNIDFAIGNVAVELKSGGATNAVADKKRGRIKYLRDYNFTTMVIAFDKVNTLLHYMDDLIGDINILNCNPTPLGEYRVVRCRSDCFIRTRNDLGQFAIEPSSEQFFKTTHILNY